MLSAVVSARDVAQALARVRALLACGRTSMAAGAPRDDATAGRTPGTRSLGPRDRDLLRGILGELEWAAREIAAGYSSALDSDLFHGLSEEARSGRSDRIERDLEAVLELIRQRSAPPS